MNNDDDKKSIVRKHNVLIEARHTKLLDVRAMRLVALAAARISVKDKDFQTYQIPVKAITSSPDVYLRTEDNSLVIDKITDQLLTNVIKLPRKDKDGQYTGKSWAKYSYFSKCQYIAGSGYVEVQFHPDLKDNFLQLKNNFTQLNLEILVSLPSTYSYRLYELLKQYAQGGIFKRQFVLSDLQDMIGVKAGAKSTYRKYSKFKEKVLIPAQRNFEMHTDLLFDFHAWADYGRSFTHIEFTLTKNSRYIQGSLFDLPETRETTEPKHPSIPQEYIDKIPKEQWENKEIGCQQICNEIFHNQGIKAVDFYINYVIELNKTEKIISWGKTIRIALKNSLFEKNIKIQSDANIRQKQDLETLLKAQEEEKINEEEKFKEKIVNESRDSIIDKVLESEKADQFIQFIAEQVEKNENELIRKRVKTGSGMTKRNMQRKYFDAYLHSLF